MDRTPRLDTRVMDLAPVYIGRPTYASDLAHIQAITYQETGHLLAYNDEYVWRRLKSWSSREGLPDLRVRCLFCYAVASLKDWARAAHRARGTRDELATATLAARPGANVRFLCPCDGATQAEAILNTLTLLCE
jgi:hypothetical protein